MAVAEDGRKDSRPVIDVEKKMKEFILIRLGMELCCTWKI
jgi:hypothetical protein